MAITKLPLKQTRLERFFKNTVSDISLEDDVLTLTTQEGKSFRIFAGTKTVQRGDKGVTGKSAYDIAKDLGKTNKSLEEWLSSLVGDKGAKGATGAKGIMGQQGNTGRYPEITVNHVKTSADISQPLITLDKQGEGYELNVTLPCEYEDHSVWFNMPYDVVPGSYVAGPANSKAVATLELIESYLYELNVTVPAGADGFAGADSIGKDGVAPEISFDVKTVDNNDFLSYNSRKTGDVVNVSVNMPRGPKGAAGSEQRVRQIVYQKMDATIKTVTDIAEIQNPVEGFCTIEFSNIGRMFGKVFGWSWRNKQGTRQIVFFNGTSHKAWYYRNGPPTGDISASINEGWIKL